jgi:hypothetical protein
MTLYNGNKTGKGRPRPKIRIQGLPAKTAIPALGPHARMSINGVTDAFKAAELLKRNKIAMLAGQHHWGRSLSFMNKAGGVLTFAPSLALDIVRNIDVDVRPNQRFWEADWHFNGHKFLTDSAKSQSGNLVGWGIGAGLAWGIAIGVGLTATPVILVGLVGGFLAQVVWSWSGGADWAEAQTKRVLGE